MAPNVLITTCESRLGFYTAREMLREKMFNKVVIGVRDISVSWTLLEIAILLGVHCPPQ
ncbi:hypothetical protein BKA69DRAFT_1073953 [Paraphysoderma sedebokerense]|nr:hypothetical protein BKA69DRAFT_1073953 [Paraphysoderma sedebokerense]